MSEKTEQPQHPQQQTEPVEPKPLNPARDIPSLLPVLPLSDVVVFPHMVAPLLVSSNRQVHLIDDVVAGNRLVAVTLMKDPEQDDPLPEHLHEYGCVARVTRMLKFPDESTRVLIQGLKRIKIVRLEKETPYLMAFSTAAIAIDGEALREEIRLELATVDALTISQVFPMDRTEEIDPTSNITVIFNHPVVPLQIKEAKGPASAAKVLP